MDTVRVVDAQAYVELLEKTNEQLSLWWNPYGVLIGALSVLFTVLTIAAAVLLYRQSREHREQIREFLERHETQIREFSDSHERQLLEFLRKHEGILAELVDQTTREVRQRLDELRERYEVAPLDERERLEPRIAALEQQIAESEQRVLQRRAAAAAAAAPGGIPPAGTELQRLGLDLTGTAWRHVCRSCGHEWSTPANKISLTGYTCPACGNVQLS